jgi:pimeloyl-ACP methyl ester carboxylesterase
MIRAVQIAGSTSGAAVLEVIDKGSSNSRFAPLLFVHGAWHGAWCWDRVVTGLTARHIPVTAVDLPGHGDDPGPQGDLHGDALAVRRVLDRMQAPVVLLGHSYGGAVITEAGDHPAVAHLVYLAALALDADETCANAASREAKAAGISHRGRPDLSAGFVPGPEGAVLMDPAVAATCLYQDCDAATTAWAVSRLGPQPLRTLQQTPHAVAWRTRPSTYVVCADDLAIHPGVQRLLARRCTDSVEWDTGHSPFLSRPDAVTSLLADTAVAVSAQWPSTAVPSGAPDDTPG